jgi:hypothetical protein
MNISGHKTRNVSDRYNIVNDQDLRDAARSKQVYFEKQNAMERNYSERGELVQFRQAHNE